MIDDSRQCDRGHAGFGLVFGDLLVLCCVVLGQSPQDVSLTDVRRQPVEQSLSRLGWSGLERSPDVAQHQCVFVGADVGLLFVDRE